MNTNNSMIVFSGGNIKGISIEDKILDILTDTEYEINIAMYRFLNEKILDVLQEKVKEGVNLNMVLDTSVNENDEYASFFFERIAGPLKEMQEKYPEKVRIKFMKDDVVMHHKLLISDRRILVTGSYNMTRSAEEKNMENIFIYESNENDKVMADALKEFFTMMGEAFSPKPLEVEHISVMKGVYIQNVFRSIERVYENEIFIMRGMTLSFWVHGKGIFCIKAENQNGRSIVAKDHFLYETVYSDSLNIYIYGTDGTCKQESYIIKLMPWKLPYTEEFKKHLDERFKIINQKLKYSGLL